MFLKTFLINRLFNSLLVSCFLINFGFLSLHTPHFDNIIIPPFIAFKTCRIVTSKILVFSPLFKTKYNLIKGFYLEVL